MWRAGSGRAWGRSSGSRSFYGEVAGGRRPAFFRRGGLDELARRNDAGELAPDFGPRQLDPGTGAVLLGVRKPLVAFNLELRGSIEVARAVAAAVRASSGGLPGVQALGLSLGGGRVEVSTNVIDLDATLPHAMVARIEKEAVARGAAIGRGELVGLIPRPPSRPRRGTPGSPSPSTMPGSRPLQRSPPRRAPCGSIGWTTIGFSSGT